MDESQYLEAHAFKQSNKYIGWHMKFDLKQTKYLKFLQTFGINKKNLEIYETSRFFAFTICCK